MALKQKQAAGERVIGVLLRRWREHRRMSQLDLASEAEISQKHLSFIESGRAAPSREMVLLLSDSLDMPLRERNALLLAAGYAPVYRERTWDDPALVNALATLKHLLKAHEPFPALVLDRHWTMVLANSAIAALLSGIAPEKLAPPVNVLRLSLDPHGLAPAILNLEEWRRHLLERLRRQMRLTADIDLKPLIEELLAFPQEMRAETGSMASPSDDVAVLLKLQTPFGRMSFLSTVTSFGTPTDVTLSELSLEAFYPADAETRLALEAMMASYRAE